MNMKLIEFMTRNFSRMKLSILLPFIMILTFSDPMLKQGINGGFS